MNWNVLNGTNVDVGSFGALCGPLPAQCVDSQGSGGLSERWPCCAAGACAEVEHRDNHSVHFPNPLDRIQFGAIKRPVAPNKLPGAQACDYPVKILHSRG